MYHMVSDHRPKAKFNKLRVTPKNFDSQIRWLKENGWKFVTMSQLLDASPSQPANHDGVEKLVAITFDDGFEDNYTHALPILQKYDAKATLYLVVDRHDRDWSTYKKAHHNSGELMRETKLSDSQVKEMLASGIFELGGHTQTHANLATISADDKAFEIGTARLTLEATFDTPVTSFAYPFGIYTADDPAMVKQFGYSNAVLAEGGIETTLHERPFEIRRIKVSGKDSLRQFCRRMRLGHK